MQIAFETDGMDLSLLPKPAGWRLLIAPVKINETTDSGIILVNETQEMAKYFRQVGKVVAVGDECYKHPKFQGGLPIELREPAPWCKIGDVVMYSSYTGTDISVMNDGKEVKLKMTNDDEVYAVLHDPSVLGFDKTGDELPLNHSREASESF